MKRVLWNPWHGCHKCSPGCQNCFVYYLDGLHGKDANMITRSKTNFNLPLKKDRSGSYKIPSHSQLATCFTSDFFLEEADEWRDEAWAIIRERKDLEFLICTKRIERFYQCMPRDWNKGYENVIIAVSVENQKKADERLPVFMNIPAQRKHIFAAPLLEDIDLTPFLKSGEFSLVSVSGESYQNARVCDFEWIKHIKHTCDQWHVIFDFHQTGSNFVMNGKRYHINHHDEYGQAKKGMSFLRQISDEKNHNESR